MFDINFVHRDSLSALDAERLSLCSLEETLSYWKANEHRLTAAIIKQTSFNNSAPSHVKDDQPVACICLDLLVEGLQAEKAYVQSCIRIVERALEKGRQALESVLAQENKKIESKITDSDTK